jgi:hypothetical protein
MAKMLRVEVREEGGHAHRTSLPPIDVASPAFVIGSAPTAAVRLPAEVAAPEHIVITDTRYRTVDGADGEIGEGITLEIGRYRVRISPAPAGTTASPPQRTDSLARELMRNLIGDGATPYFTVERGPNAGAKQKLPPPEYPFIIGRGDEATWIIADEDLSRTHAEVRRGFDGVRIMDLSSKNGTRVDGVTVGADGALLHDGAVIDLGKVAIKFHDPAERQLGELRASALGGAPAAPASTVVASPSAARAREAAPAPQPVPPRPSAMPFYAALAIMFAALAGFVWSLSLL